LTVLTISVEPAGRLVATVTVNSTVIEPGPATVTSCVQELPAWLLGHLQAAPVKVVLAGTVSVSVVDASVPPPLVTVRWYTSTSFGPTRVVGPAGTPLIENRVFIVSSDATVGVVTSHRKQAAIDEVTELPMLLVPTGKLAATVTVNDTVVALTPATSTVWTQELPALLSGPHVQPVPVKVVLAGTISVGVVVPGLPPVLVTVMLYTNTSFGPTVVIALAGVPFTDTRLFTTSSDATVGLVTVHNEQVPVDEVIELPMVVVPAGRLAATATVNNTGTVAPPATVTSWVQVLPALSLGVQVQPSLCAPVKVVLAGTVSVRVVVPGLPPELVSAI
jgi:hypothetical protein